MTEHTDREKTACQMRTFIRETLAAMQAGDADRAYYLSVPGFHRAGLLLDAPDVPVTTRVLLHRAPGGQEVYA